MTKFLFDEKEILEAFFKATNGKPEEGSVGAGLGLRAFGWKGGVGTSSRLLSLGGENFACGALAATNHANRSSKESDQSSDPLKDQEGSLAIILATDVPLLPHQIKQILRLFMANLAPLQTWDKSQDSVSAVLFSTANAMSMVDRGPLVFDFRAIDDSFLGRVTRAFSEAVQEAIFHSLLEASAMDGRLGRKIEKIPQQEFLKLQKNFGG